MMLQKEINRYLNALSVEAKDNILSQLIHLQANSSEAPSKAHDELIFLVEQVREYNKHYPRGY